MGKDLSKFTAPEGVASGPTIADWLGITELESKVNTYNPRIDANAANIASQGARITQNEFDIEALQAATPVTNAGAEGVVTAASYTAAKSAVDTATNVVTILGLGTFEATTETVTGASTGSPESANEHDGYNNLVFEVSTGVFKKFTRTLPKGLNRVIEQDANAPIDSGDNITTELLASLSASGGGDRILPVGTFYLTPEQTVLGTGKRIKGLGRHFTTVIRPAAGTYDWLIELGTSSGKEPANGLENVDIRGDEAGAATNALLVYRGSQFSTLEKVRFFQGEEAGDFFENQNYCLVIKEYANEIAWRDVGFFGGNPNKSVCIFAEDTGSADSSGIEAYSITFEDSFIGMDHQTSIIESRWTFYSFYCERIKFPFILNNMRMKLVGTKMVNGTVWLKDGMAGSDLDLATPNQADGGQSATIDNGVGNIIRRGNSGRRHQNEMSVDNDGAEWLRVANAESNPIGIKSYSGWTATNATQSFLEATIPNINRGKTMTVAASSANGYVEKTYTLTGDTDALALIGIYSGESATVATHRFKILDSSDSNIFDSGLIDLGKPYRYKFQKEFIRVPADGVIKLRLYGVVGSKNHYPFIGIFPSEFNMASASGNVRFVNGTTTEDVSTPDLGTVSNAVRTYSISGNSAYFPFPSSVQNWKGKVIVHFKSKRRGLGWFDFGTFSEGLARHFAPNPDPSNEWAEHTLVFPRGIYGSFIHANPGNQAAIDSTIKDITFHLVKDHFPVEELTYSRSGESTAEAALRTALAAAGLVVDNTTA